MGSCVGKKHNEQAYIDPECLRNTPLNPCILPQSKEDMDAMNARTRIVVAEQNDVNALKCTQQLKRNNFDKEKRDEKSKTLVLKSKQIRKSQQYAYIDARVEHLLKKDRLMHALYSKIRDRFEE